MKAKIVKFKVWDTSKPRWTAKELTPKEMKEFVEKLHRLPLFSQKPHNGLLRNARGVRVDVRGGVRLSDFLFSRWHRTLHPGAYYTDIDGMEYDIEGEDIKLRAIYDIKEWHVTQEKYLEKNANFRAIKKLAEIANIPFFVIWVKYELYENE